MGAYAGLCLLLVTFILGFCFGILIGFRFSLTIFISTMRLRFVTVFI